MNDTRRPKVSICLATYNQAAYIEKCVLGALAQASDVDLELLVGNDHSTDGTSEILASLALQFPERMIVLNREANMGGTENYQDLVRRASGDFIAHLDGDDVWLPGKLLAQTRFMADHLECISVYTNAIVLDDKGGAIGTFTNAHPSLMGVGYVAAKGNFLMHSSMLYRTSYRDKFLRLQPPVIDYLIHLTLAKAGPLGFINRDLAVYHCGTAASMTSRSLPLVQRLSWRAVICSLGDLTARDKRAPRQHLAAAVLIARLRVMPTRIRVRTLTKSQPISGAPAQNCSLKASRTYSPSFCTGCASDSSWRSGWRHGGRCSSEFDWAASFATAMRIRRDGIATVFRAVNKL